MTESLVIIQAILVIKLATKQAFHLSKEQSDLVLVLKQQQSRMLAVREGRTRDQV